MGNSSSKKRSLAQGSQGSSTDVEPRSFRDFSPFRKSPKGPSIQSGSDILDVPSKPGKALVTLTNLQSDKPSGSCVTDSIYLDWKASKVDGGRPILGYIVEMYDLPTGNWVPVTQTEGIDCRSILDNILCGIMYRFRVRAYNEIGNSVPGIPSDAFVIDTPGVHIAPYFILCPPPEATRTEHDTVMLRVKALGTPKPNILWQKDEEPIFITEGVEIQEETDGSVLTVHNIQMEDQGVIQCVAVNHVGKAVATTLLTVVCLPQFSKSSSPLQFTFRAEEIIRLKFPIKVNPEPELKILKNNIPLLEREGQIFFRDGAVIVKMDAARVEHTGSYTVVADNGHGKDQVTFILDVEVPPDPPGQPEILEVSPTGQLSLAWDAPPGQDIDHYIVEYYRDQWQLWLRMKTCLDTDTVVTDLIPGSKYKFRIMSASIAGISEPSPETEEVMIGTAPEDELFDLPGKGRQGRRRMLGGTRKMPSLDRSSIDRTMGPRGSMSSASPNVNRRHVSLDREVYYDSDNIRRDVVAFNQDTRPEVSKLGHLTGRYKLSNDEMAKYKTSMSQLCNKMKTISSSSLVQDRHRTSRTSITEATHHLKMEVSNQARISASLSQLNTPEGAHIERERPVQSTSQSELGSGVNRRLSRDTGECRQSLTDIRDRIGSLQSLLRTSRTLTASKSKLFADMPTLMAPLSAPGPKPHSLPTPVSHTQRKASRSDSYSQAIDDDDLENQYQETHFPYNAEDVTVSTTLLCDKAENRQSGLEPQSDSPIESPTLPALSTSPTFLTNKKDASPRMEATDDVANSKKDKEEVVEVTPDATTPVPTVLEEFSEKIPIVVEELQTQTVEKSEEENPEVESRPLSMMSTKSVTSCRTLCDSSVTELVDTDTTLGRQRLTSASSQGTLIASDCDLPDDDEEDNSQYEL